MRSRFGLADEFIEIKVEDELTKAVFGGLQLLSPETLNAVFADTKFDLSFSSAPEFIFHEQVDRRIPDVIIDESPQTTVIVEAKLGADTDTTQLAEEYNDLASNWQSKTKRLIHITSDRTRPRALDSIEGIPDENLVWMSWRELATNLLALDSDAMDTAGQNAVEMLIDILDHQGFTPFGGFTTMTQQEDNFTTQLTTAYEIREQYQRETNTFRKDVETHLDQSIAFWRFFRSGAVGHPWAGTESFPSKHYQRITRNLWYAYRPTDFTWETGANSSSQNYLFIDFNSKTGVIRAGYSMKVSPGSIEDDIFRRSLHQHRERVLDIIHDEDLKPVTTTHHFGTRIDTLDGMADFLEVIGDGSYDEDSYGKRFLLAREWEPDELPLRPDTETRMDAKETILDVADCLNEIHDLTYNHHRDVFYPML